MINPSLNLQSFSSFFSKIFRSPYVIPLAILISVVAAVWFLLPKISIGDSVPFESTLARVIVLVILGVFAVAYMISVRMILSNQQERAAEEDPEVIRKRLAKERKEFSKNVDKAFAALKNVFTHGQKRKHYLYKLPWYLLIGLPGSGKSTTIINSGLKLSLRRHLNRDVQTEIAHLGQYEWWLTEDAVILDAAKYKGETPIQGEKGSEWNSPMQNASWMAVLKLLKHLREERPLSGVVVTVSLPDLIANKEEESRAYIHFIRQRIQTIHEQLEISVPIYLILTKCDCIAGFSEFFANLNQEQRSQVWGMTVPFNQSSDIRKVSDFFDRSFDGLLKRLQEKLIVRLSEEQDRKKRERIALFPNQVQLCKQYIADLIVETFSAAHYYEGESLQLRGIYLTSAMQEGNPHDLLMDRVADRYHLQHSKLPTQPTQGRSYFIKSIFQKVIFPEANLVGYSDRARRKQERKSKIILSSAIGSLVALSITSTVAYYDNKSNLVEIKDHLKQYRKIANHADMNIRNEKEVLPLLSPLQAIIDTYQTSRLRWLKYLTLYHPYKLTKTTEEALNRTINYYFLPQVLRQLETKLQNNLDNSRDVYELLTAYLVFDKNQYVHQQTTVKQMQKIWLNHYPNDYVTQQQLGKYLKFALQRQQYPQPLNQSLIQRAKHRLAEQIPTEQAYQLLMQNLHESDDFRFSMTDHFAPLLQRFFIPEKIIRSIPGVFTAEGARKLYLAQAKIAAKDISDLNWNLEIINSKPTNAEINQIIEHMRVIYVNDYHKYWLEALNSMQVVPFRNLNHAINILTFLTGNQNPLQSMLHTIEQQISFSGKHKDIADTFVELHDFIKSDRLTEVLQALTQLRDYLSEINNAPNNQEAAFTAAWEYMSGDSANPISKLRALAQTLPEPLQNWINAVAQNSLNALLKDANAVIAQAWEKEILPEFEREFSERFPFARGSEHQVDLSKFTQYFAPNGTIDSFYDRYLKVFVDNQKNTWKIREEAKDGLAFSQRFIASIQRAREVSRVYFADQQKTPRLAFSLSPRHLDSSFSRMRLKIGNKEIKYQHGPQQRQQFIWPLLNDSEKTEIVLTDFNGRSHSEVFSGPWGLFKLLDKANLKTIRPGQYTLTLTVGRGRVSFNLSSTQDISAFQLSLLRSINFPKTVD